MKILFVSPYLASPPECGAHRRIEGLMRGLSLRHEVSMLSFAVPDAGKLSATKAYCRRVITIEPTLLRLDSSRKRLVQLRSLLSTKSFEYVTHHDVRLQTQLDQLMTDGEFDLVQVEFAQMGIYRVPPRRRPILVLDEHNVEYDIVRRTANAEVGALRKIYSAINWRKMRAEEVDAWRRFDGVALTSRRDEDLLKLDAPATPTSVIPNAVDLEAFTPNNDSVEPATLLFFGALDYHPNLEGVEYFLSEIMPSIQRRLPQVKLRVVGRNPPSSLLALQSESVEFTGYVDDPRGYIDRAAVVIVPLRIGGGTRFKIVEAMAKGKPIVSTRIGAEGLDAEHGTHLLLADTPSEFVDSVCKLCADPDLASKVGDAGRQFVAAHYGWDSVVRKLESFYEALAGRRRDKTS